MGFLGGEEVIVARVDQWPFSFREAKDPGQHKQLHDIEWAREQEQQAAQETHKVTQAHKHARIPQSQLVCRFFTSAPPVIHDWAMGACVYQRSRERAQTCLRSSTHLLL